jgi:MoaA/NifB/PqqE/SkfB family radical SAM enzyme
MQAHRSMMRALKSTWTVVSRARLISSNRPPSAPSDSAPSENEQVALRNAKLLRDFYERDRLPTGVMIQISAKCNLGCQMCGYVGKTPNVGFISFELFERVLEACREVGLDSIWFETAWGEPMLHPNIFELLERAHGFKVMLSTNITPLNRRRIERLADMGLHHLQLSFFGFDKVSYERTYVGAKFEHIVENMRTVCEVFSIRSPATQLLVNGVALENDPSLVVRTTAFVQSLGFSDEQMLFNLPHNFGGQYHGSPTDLNTGVNTYKDLRGLKPDLCSVLLNSPGVYVDGRVTACGCLDNSAALIIGDIRTQGFREMRHGTRFDALLKAFVNGDISEVPLCDKCDVPYCGNNTKRAPGE